MVDVSRRRALGLAGGALGLGGCSLLPGRKASVLNAGEIAIYEGEVAFEHGVASGDPLPDGVVLWTRVTPKSGSGPIAVAWRIFDGDNIVIDSGTQTSAAQPAAANEKIARRTQLQD